MRRFFLILATVICATSISFAQITKTLNVGDFNGVDVSGDISVTLTTEGEDVGNFMYELPDNVDESQFEWENKNGILVVKLRDQIVIGKGKKVKPTAKVTIVYKELGSIQVSSKASVLADQVIEAELLTIKTGSVANVAVEVDVRNLDIVSSTSSKITLTGSVEFLTVKASSMAYVNTITMECENALINANTNAECYATSKVKFEAKATTNSNIFYKGEPEIVVVSSSSLGNVEHF
ncbi:MAG: DUF2807 domain-containing protein [Rikenellaceae bacterium]